MLNRHQKGQLARRNAAPSIPQILFWGIPVNLELEEQTPPVFYPPRILEVEIVTSRALGFATFLSTNTQN